MEFTAQQIAGFIDGKIEGNLDVTVNALAKIEEGRKGSISFLANPKYNHYLYSTESSIVIINEDFVLESDVSTTLIRVKDAYTAFAKVLNAYQKATSKVKAGISSLAFVHSSANIGKDVYIGEFAFIGANASIGNNSSIYPLSYIGENVKIGNDCLIHPAVKILDD